MARGDWNSWTTYNAADFVFYNGNVYVAMAEAGGNPPDSDGRWRLLIIVGPVGPQGGSGPPGDTGPAGPQGPAGLPGDVSSQQLTDTVNNAIAATARNPNSFAAYAGNFSDPPTVEQLRSFRDWANALLAAIVR
jgi:hypothetical protein